MKKTLEKNCFLLEVGVLLKSDHPEYEHYNKSYDGKHGYYDENQCYHRKLKDAKENALNYVLHGVDQTYAVVSATWVDKEIDVDNDDVDVEYERYDIRNVVYSVMKDGDMIKENFINVPIKDIKDCRYTYDVAELIAKKVMEKPDFEKMTVSHYGPFGVSGESSVSVIADNGDIIGTIDIHYSKKAASGFSYGKSKEHCSRLNKTVEKVLPVDTDKAVDCVFEMKKLTENIMPLVNNLKDESCVKLHNKMCDNKFQAVYHMSSYKTMYDKNGNVIDIGKSEDFDEQAPYYVVDCINPDEPYYFAKYEYRSIRKYDEIYDSPYKKEKKTPREMLAGNIAYMGYVDDLKNI